MPRMNDEPVKCWGELISGHNISLREPNCRFLVLGHCQRNPNLMHFIPLYGHGCFVGEPIMQRSCNNCRFEETTACHIYAELHYCLRDKPGWHCSYWEVKE
jgi:hypothetical protein